MKINIINFSSISILFLTTALTLNACNKKNTTQHPASINFNNNIGWSHGECIATNNKTLTAGMPVKLILLEEPQVIIQTNIISRTSSGSHCPPLLEDRKQINNTANKYFYTIKLDKKYNESMGIAFFNTQQKLTRKKELVLVDINNNGNTETSSTCTTSEGIKFILSENSGNKKTTVWEDYYYLGYDLTPTCTD